MIDLDEVEAQVDGAHDLSRLNIKVVRDLASELREMRACLKRIARMVEPPHPGDLGQGIWQVISDYYAAALPGSMSDPQRRNGE